jgi:hypothetical protein
VTSLDPLIDRLVNRYEDEIRFLREQNAGLMAKLAEVASPGSNARAAYRVPEPRQKPTTAENAEKAQLNKWLLARSRTDVPSDAERAQILKAQEQEIPVDTAQGAPLADVAETTNAAIHDSFTR